ncbi:hypothetical protein GCM10017687_82250 [Streptomyces echinatus]|uniref:Uncharacterized protein n=1 Tax=Streptomyces echinatus TaxID=67293 RepID=A0A7W9PUT8_9ACTN|nr:hypothetical protein [Streptomyces echinatus]
MSDPYDGALRRPRGGPGSERSGGPGTGAGRPQPVPKRRVPGPRCPACHHGNPTTRVRCEICGHELWRGGASTLAPAPAPLPVPPEPDPRGGTGRLLALVLAPVVVMAALIALVYLLG